MFNVLFLCTGNSARSIMAEALLNHPTIGRQHFRAFSAGSHPAGTVHPLALETLAAQHVATDGLRSKSWDEFGRPDAPKMDFVFTVCDQAAAEVCPVWPGQPMTAHWGVPDPAAATGSNAALRRVFRDACLTLRRRIELFTALPFEKLSTLALEERVREIGKA
jgi:arsenate reductase